MLMLFMYVRYAMLEPHADEEMANDYRVRTWKPRHDLVGVKGILVRYSDSRSQFVHVDWTIWNSLLCHAQALRFDRVK